MDEKSLILIDPTDIRAYTEPNGIFDNLKSILEKKPSIFFFIPQRLKSKKSEEHEEIVYSLRNSLQLHRMQYTDRVLHIKKGWFSREDHNIVVCNDKDILEKVENNHIIVTDKVNRTKSSTQR